MVGNFPSERMSAGVDRITLAAFLIRETPVRDAPSTADKRPSRDAQRVIGPSSLAGSEGDRRPLRSTG